jgi:hypothetical protein
MVFTHLLLFLGRDRTPERRIRKERGISRMSVCKKARADANDPGRRHTNSVEGYPQEAAARILNNPSAAFVDNPRRGVDDLWGCGYTAPGNAQLMREEGGFGEEKRSETSLTNRG